jgi:hypothetical protein
MRNTHTKQLSAGTNAATTFVRYNSWRNRIGSVVTSALKPKIE